MRIKAIIILLFIIGGVAEVHAQLNLRPLIKRKTAEAAFTMNTAFYDGRHWGVGANIHYMWGIGRNKQRFNIGIGLRQYNYFGRDREYSTSDQALVAKLKNGPDSLYFPKISSHLMNSYIALMFHVKRGVDIGAHIDIGGITFGGSKEAYFHSYELTLGQNKKVLTQPFAFNFNPFFTNSGYGSSFNSLYVQFGSGNIMRYRLGVDYFISETNTKTPQTGNGTRFRNNNLMVQGSICWNIRHNRPNGSFWNNLND
jgi:hypothetical protein